MNGLLLPAQRQARAEKKLRAVLRWLRDETWSTPEVLGTVMQLNSRQATYKSLRKLESEGYIASTEMQIFKKKTQLIFGITSHGLAHAFDLNEPLENRPVFEPSRVALTTLQHEIDIQLLRVRAECAGWTQWMPGTRLGASRPGEKRPDAVALSPNQQVVAIEVERTAKTKKRYEALLSQYFQAAARGKYHLIVWVSPTEDFCGRLKRLIGSITAVPVGSKRINLEQRHFDLMQFHSYHTWPNSISKEKDK
ncbi:MAG: replication-relaxation family protein [Rhodocyclaceae bacterium]|nr:replication-relaxation family protein [Rhodocyclaceae bacterium]MCA3032323.1 replication-relaxation family protein [Rhodocyclaceae bacterium]MCA3050362.1 replication-relaxation family protein [Rhodocyclaceae bacterium]